jgi:hypothetical protein
MELYKLHMLSHPPELPNGPTTYTLMVAREASPSGSVQSANFPSWDLLARKPGSVGLGEAEVKNAKKELDASRYYRITGVPLSPVQIELLGYPKTSSDSAVNGAIRRFHQLLGRLPECSSWCNSDISRQ